MGIVASWIWLRERTLQGFLKGRAFFVETKAMMEFNCIEDGHVGLEALPKLVSASSCVAFTNKALVAKANKFPRIAPLSSLGLLDPGNWLLRMLFQKW